MTTIAPMSSTTARPSRKAFSAEGTRSPARAITPTARAMSVAIGTPQPRALVPPAMSRYTTAGTAIPPIAAASGRADARLPARWPLVTSRLISRPTTKNNTALTPSVTPWRRSSANPCPPRSIVSSVPHSES
jgi:hypothetical protein